MREGVPIVYRRGVVSAVLALIFVGGASLVWADTATHVIINELMWDGTEYIELFNPTEETVSLVGWKLTRQQMGGDEKTLITLAEGAEVGPGEYFLIERSEAATTVAADATSSSLILVNTGERVRLKDASSALVDEANHLGAWFAGEVTGEGAAMERGEEHGAGDEETSWHTSTGAGGGRVGTPAAANSEPASNAPPEAAMSVAGDEIMAGDTVVFSGEDSSDSDGDELTFAWNFGDTSTAAGVTASHKFSQPGSYLVTLEVSDSELTDTATTTLTVTAPVYTDGVVINEFLPNPVGSDTTAEFIELKNTTGAAVDLGGWQLDDAEGGSVPYTIPAATTIAAGGHISFSRLSTKIALNNEGDSVRLLDPVGSVKSNFTYTDSIAEGVSYSRNAAGSFTLSTTVTAGLANIITAPAVDNGEDEEEGVAGDYSDKILINELLANPAGSDTESEFIELINTGSSAVSLTGWQIDDEDGGSSPYTISAGVSLAAGEIKAFSRADTKIALNNDSDTARLLDPSGKVVSSTPYDESMAEGVALARDSTGHYALTTTVTEGEKNIITAPTGEAGTSIGPGQVAGTSAKQVELKNVRQEEEGQMVTVEGVVSAEAGWLGKGVLYVAGSGIQVYFSKAEYPELVLGDTAKVTGELGSYGGEARLTVGSAAEITRVKSGEAPTPHQVKTGEIGEALEGSLVLFVGKVTQTSGDTFYVDDGSGEIKVFIKESTEIDKPPMKKGVVVTIIGIVSETSSGYRVLPRVQADVRLGAVAGLTSFPGAGVVAALPAGWEALALAVSVWLLPRTYRRGINDQVL